MSTEYKSVSRWLDHNQKDTTNTWSSAMKMFIMALVTIGVLEYGNIVSAELTMPLKGKLSVMNTLSGQTHDFCHRINRTCKLAPCFLANMLFSIVFMQ